MTRRRMLACEAQMDLDSAQHQRLARRLDRHDLDKFRDAGLARAGIGQKNDAGLRVDARTEEAAISTMRAQRSVSPKKAWNMAKVSGTAGVVSLVWRTTIEA